MKDYKQLRVTLLIIFVIIMIVTIILLLLDAKFIETVLVSIGSFSVLIKVRLEFKIIGVQNNALVKEQKNNKVLKSQVQNLNEQNNVLVKKQEVYRAELIEIKNVEHQIVYPSKLSLDDTLMKNIRNNLDNMELDLQYNGLLNSWFNSLIYDELCIFITGLNSAMYKFVDVDLNKIFTKMKKDLKEFNDLYYENVVRNDKGVMVQLKYNYMIQWKWDRNYEEKEFKKAENDMKRINELLNRIVRNFHELFDTYIEKKSPPSE